MSSIEQQQQDEDQIMADYQESVVSSDIDNLVSLSEEAQTDIDQSTRAIPEFTPLDSSSVSTPGSVYMGMLIQPCPPGESIYKHVFEPEYIRKFTMNNIRMSEAEKEAYEARCHATRKKILERREAKEKTYTRKHSRKQH